MNRVCVIIPQYGKEEYTRKCIEFTKKNAGIDIDILVVDDGSDIPFQPKPCVWDEETRRATIDDVNILRIEKNSGFTNATNQGILWCGDRYEYVLTLNNDTEPEPDFLKHLVESADADPSIGIIGSVRRYPNTNQYETCGADLIRGHQWLAEDLKGDGPIEVNWFPICSGLLRMSMVREIGLLDKRFRNHCSDADYCITAKIHKWKVMIHPKSVVVHHLSVTTTANNINVGNDQRLFVEKLACLDYAKLMKQVPLDMENKTYGKLEFSVETR